jgi:alanyl-tRNA synthetase
VRVLVEVLQNVVSEYLQFYATALARYEKVVALLAVQESGALLFAQHSGAGHDMNALLGNLLGQFGGKGGGSKDFARGALSDPAKIPDALALARSLVEQKQTLAS